MSNKAQIVFCQILSGLFILTMCYLIYESYYLIAWVLFLVSGLLLEFVDRIEYKVAIQYFRNNPVGNTSDVQAFYLEENIEIELKKLTKYLKQLEKSGYIRSQGDDFWFSNLKSSSKNLETEEISLD